MLTIKGETYYTLAEAAEKMDVSRTTIYRWRRDDGLDAVIVGRKPYVSESQLAEFVEPSSSCVTAEGIMNALQ